jgi:hypothetical protein
MAGTLIVDIFLSVDGWAGAGAWSTGLVSQNPQDWAH